jgi:hypothetical protein
MPIVINIENKKKKVLSQYLQQFLHFFDESKEVFSLKKKRLVVICVIN